MRYRGPTPRQVRARREKQRERRQLACEERANLTVAEYQRRYSKEVECRHSNLKWGQLRVTCRACGLTSDRDGNNARFADGTPVLSADEVRAGVQ